jgi:cytoskeleton protein RodZ
MSDVVEAEVENTTAETDATPPPWDQLREAREQKNLQQSDIAKELKLDLRFVKALEEGRLDALPQPVYTAGYIRAYAKLVGLPADKIVGDYTSKQSTKLPEIASSSEKVPARYRHLQTALPKSFSVSHEHMDEKKKVRLLVIVLVVVVALAIAWQITSKMTESTPASTKEVSENGDLTGTQDSPESGADTGTTTIDLAIPGQTSEQQSSVTEPGDQQVTDTLQGNAKQMASILLRYSEDSWVDIRDATGKPLIRRLGTAGGSNKVTGVAPFEVLLGYSPGVSIEINGKPFDMSMYQKRPVARFILDGSGQATRQTIKQPEASQTDSDGDKAQFYVAPD